MEIFRGAILLVSPSAVLADFLVVCLMLLMITTATLISSPPAQAQVQTPLVATP